ncbi:matrixin family metalloprotease [Candidatus Daviesbacteria bacterium]|nr:matrixin family metalloprotease [Candidatus Daviesbacteria bacterium]
MFKKLAALVSIASSLFLFSGAALAVPPLQTATLATPGTQRTLTLPASADNSNVISLGSAVDPGTGKVVEGLAIIHKKSPARPGGAKTGSTSCYTYLAKGARWKVVEPWITNPLNTRGLDGTNVFNILAGGVSKWEDATDGTVGNGAGVDVLGQGAITSATLVADTTSPDNQNEVYFADISDPGVIAVTIIWGIFGGPPFGRELVEWDQVYDDVSFDWSAEASGVAGKMDFDNIATHELGHSVGMGDLYNSCVDETMYGYATSAETKKRDLNSGDIQGINSLY